ncbi:MAG: hypothetical protein U0L18_02585 [Acutalibacteraceae bacterium]|nr:hypothetical protein [Acutalibacteraceae bacterium]
MYEKLFNSIDIDISNTNSEAISTEDKNNIANNVRKEIRICINESFNNILKNELLRIKKKEIEDLIKKENPSFDFGDLGTFIDLDDKLIVYEINSMISTENFYSKILEKKYKNIYTDARKLLKVLTLEKYNISNKNIFTFYPSKIKNFKKKTCNITALIKVSQHKFGTDITKRFNLFLEACNKSDKFSTQNNKNKYYISLYDCIPFVLHYMFYEGKKFLEENDNPKFSEENSCSMKSYRIVLSHVLKLFTDKNVSNPCYIDRIFEAAQLYRIDNEFNFFKISRLTYQREQFMNEENFNSIFGFFNQETKEEQTLRQSKDIEKLQKYINLRQEKIKKTKEIIEQEIFKDKDFMRL